MTSLAKLRALVLLAALVRTAPISAAVTTLSIGTPDGRARTAVVHEPAGWNGTSALPVVLVFHGGGGNAEGTEGHVGMDETADNHGFLAVYPEGVGKRRFGKSFGTWNGGYCCGEAMEQGVDDVAFVGQLLDELAIRWPMDEKRIYATGISNGGVMSLALACRMADRIAAVAPIGSPGAGSDCAPSRPVPVLLIHGTEDTCAPYGGGETCGGCWSRFFEETLGTTLDAGDIHGCAGALEQLESWRAANTCSPESARTWLTTADAVCVRYDVCAGDATAALCTVGGGGHTWPGAELACNPKRRLCQTLLSILGPTSTATDANEIMWAFFSEHALP